MQVQVQAPGGGGEEEEEEVVVCVSEEAALIDRVKEVAGDHLVGYRMVCDQEVNFRTGAVLQCFPEKDEFFNFVLTGVFILILGFPFRLKSPLYLDI